MSFDELDSLLEENLEEETSVSERPLVVVIDDDDHIRESVEFSLKDIYKVRLCASGSEGISAIDDEVHVVILDIKMKGMDGFATCQEIKKTYPHTPIIFHSAYQDLKNPFQIMNEYRPCGYVSKGSDLNALLNSVARAVEYYAQILKNRQLVNQLEEANNDLQKAFEQTRKKEQEVKVINEIVRLINQESDFDVVLKKILETLFLLIPSVERAFCMIYDSEQQAYIIQKRFAHREENFKQDTINKDWKNEFFNHVKYFTGWATITLQKGIKHWGLYTESALPKAVLTITVDLEEEFVAFFHFDNKDNEDAFTREMLKQVQGLTEHIKSAFIRANILRALRESEAQQQQRAQEMENLSSKLAKYLSPQVYNSIFSGEKDVKLETHRKKLTVFFSDIQNFTKTTDRMESEDLTALLNDYLNEMAEIALVYGGTIDKYIGDAIMIFFGDPATKGEKEDALACVMMALKMQERMRFLQKKWKEQGISDPLQIRIGINTGYCTVGNFGSEDRLDYTIIGGEVNLASRLESNAVPGQILISYETYVLIKDRVVCERKEEITVKGIIHPVQAYQVIDLQENLTENKNMFSEESEGFLLSIDFNELPDSEKEKAYQYLQQASDKLKSK